MGACTPNLLSNEGPVAGFRPKRFRIPRRTRPVPSPSPIEPYTEHAFRVIRSIPFSSYLPRNSARFSLYPACSFDCSVPRRNRVCRVTASTAIEYDICIGGHCLHGSTGINLPFSSYFTRAMDACAYCMISERITGTSMSGATEVVALKETR